MSTSYADTTITAEIDHHGTFSTTAMNLDTMLNRHLPTSVAKMQSFVTDVTGIDYSDVHDMIALLIVLADIDSNGFTGR